MALGEEERRERERKIFDVTTEKAR